MGLSTVAVNLRRLRSTKALTQGCVADEAGLSLAAYRKIESGQSAPRAATLQVLAGALGVRLDALVSPVRPLERVRFRSLKRLRTRPQILVEVGRWLADFGELEELVAEPAANLLARLDLGGTPTLERAELAADLVRKLFDVCPDEPIRDICGLLEAHGIKVGQLRVASHDFFGLSVAQADGGPAVVVNTWDRISVERWIFTAAHELGHLVLHLGDYDVNATEEPEAHERQANAFAAAFLMPDVAFRAAWGTTSGMPFVDRVLKVKRLFHVSYRTVLYRLAAGFQGNIWARFQGDYRQRYGRTLLRDDEPDALAHDAFRASFPEVLAAGEPEHLSQFDFPGDRLSRLVRRGVEAGLISLGRGAEILGRSLLEMRQIAAAWVG
jgi:Zn-dependent peptidase ImmA (M78 family)/transcriptional regulator with XRE-family HTH domain